MIVVLLARSGIYFLPNRRKKWQISTVSSSLSTPRLTQPLEALAALKELSKDKVVKLKDAAVVTKTPKGKIKIHQTKDDKAGKGFVKGGLVGILFAARPRASWLDRRWRDAGHCICDVRPGN